MQEQELFNNYEIKTWEFNPRIYKILAGSVAFNILALAIVAQSNLLTTKGCDSPLVGKVCSVIDTVVFGGTILATDAGYVDDPYTKTELTENDEVTWVNVADKLKYPEGYFALANPELAAQQQLAEGGFPTDIPGIPNPIPSTGGGSLLETPQQLPPATNDVLDGNLPSSPLSSNPSPAKPYRPKPMRTPKIPKESPSTLPKLNPDPTTQAEVNPDNPTVKEQTPLVSDPAKGPTINKKPLKDFAANVKTKYRKKEIDLTQNFTVVADGILTKEGKLDVSVDKRTRKPKTQITKAEGDERMIELAKEAMAALGDSGWLLYLSQEGVEKVNFSITQDNENLIVRVVSDQPSKERAATVSSKLNGIIQAALIADKNGLVKLGEDEKVLLSSARVASEEKLFVLNLVLPKPVAQEMITRKLNEEDKPETKPSSTAQIKEKSAPAGK
jgi:hypothetical protein